MKKNFSREVFHKYLFRINSEKSLKENKKLYAEAMDWLNWLRSKNKISNPEYLNYRYDLDSASLNSLKRKGENKLVNPDEDIKKVYLIGKYVLMASLLFFLAACYLLFLTVNKYKSDTELNTNVSSIENFRTIPFKGNLKTKDGRAIDLKTDVYFNLYSSGNDSKPIYTGNCLGENGIEPEYNGAFTIVLGSDCGMKPIPNQILENRLLYLGVKINNDPEIRPRYKISTSGYSLDSAMLGGFSIGKKESTIPYIDEDGTIKLENDSPVINSITGLFSIVGESIRLEATSQQNGDIFLQPAAGGNALISSGSLGIGDLSPRTKLSVAGIEPFSSIANIRNLSTEDDSQTSVLDLELSTGAKGRNAAFINFIAGSTRDKKGERVGLIKLNNTRVVYETAGADFAEYFDLPNNSKYENGTIVSLTKRGIKAASQQENVLGVVSNSAGFVGNSNQKNSNSVLIGMVGQLDVFVTSEDGPIYVGDAISISKLAPGFGRKSSDGSFKIGYSLGNMNLTEEIRNYTPITCPKEVSNFDQNITCGKIKVILRL